MHIFLNFFINSYILYIHKNSFPQQNLPTPHRVSFPPANDNDSRSRTGGQMRERLYDDESRATDHSILRGRALAKRTRKARNRR
jgi:hypothetical protein